MVVLVPAEPAPDDAGDDRTRTRSGVTADDPPLEISGMVSLALDARGNLVRFRAVPPQIDAVEGDRRRLRLGRRSFARPGSTRSASCLSAPKWLPPTFSDARAEWDGIFERQPDVPIHVTAAAYRGQPVYFEVLGPWDRPMRMPEVRRARQALRRRRPPSCSWSCRCWRRD